jgi:hypothetical protein
MIVHVSHNVTKISGQDVPVLSQGMTRLSTVAHPARRISPVLLEVYCIENSGYLSPLGAAVGFLSEAGANFLNVL